MSNRFRLFIGFDLRNLRFSKRWNQSFEPKPFARKHELGTFSLIGKAKTRINTPENVPRLVDLVQLSDPKYLAVFYYALRDTLVADEIDQASRVGLHGHERFRVVTLKGEIVDSNGTLTGGGNRVVSGKMGTRVSSTVWNSENLRSSRSGNLGLLDAFE